MMLILLYFCFSCCFILIFVWNYWFEFKFEHSFSSLTLTPTSTQSDDYTNDGMWIFFNANVILKYIPIKFYFNLYAINHILIFLTHSYTMWWLAWCQWPCGVNLSSPKSVSLSLSLYQFLLHWRVFRKTLKSVAQKLK